MSVNARYDDVFRHQKILRDANRRLLKEICPKSIHDHLFELLSKAEPNVTSFSSSDISVSSDNGKITDTNKEIENGDDDEEDAGYKSGALDISEDISPEDKIQNKLSSSQTNILSSKIPFSRKPPSQSRRPSSASRISSKKNNSSPFHERCKPIEPNRHFIAMPLPSNLYQSDSIKASGKQEFIKKEYCDILLVYVLSRLLNNIYNSRI